MGETVEDQGASFGPGSRKPSQQVVSALRASIPRALTDHLFRLLGTKRYSLHWGTYPQRAGTRHSHVGGWFVTAEEAQASAYRLGAHWYQIYDDRGDEVWSSDNDVAIYRQVTAIAMEARRAETLAAPFTTARACKASPLTLWCPMTNRTPEEIAREAETWWRMTLLWGLSTPVWLLLLWPCAVSSLIAAIISYRQYRKYRALAVRSHLESHPK